MGWYKPEDSKPALAVYRESPIDPWRLCEDADVPLPIATLDLGDVKESPGINKMHSLKINLGYDQKAGLINLVLHAHPEHRLLIDYYL